MTHSKPPMRVNEKAANLQDDAGEEKRSPDESDATSSEDRDGSNTSSDSDEEIDDTGALCA